MKKNGTLIVLSILLLFVSAVAMYTVFSTVPSTPSIVQHLDGPRTVTPPKQQNTVLWRVPVSATANHPTPLPCGWLVTEGNGHIISLTGMGDIRWQASYSNFLWQGSAVVDDENVCAITQKGQLVLFDAATGAIHWSIETQASCLHPPVVETVNQQHVILLLSQEDGTLTCINARDGSLRWRSSSTSRSDGPLVRFNDLIAYGNCDAAVHLFSLTTGVLKGSIQLEEDEQVAGAILPLPNGNLIVGTRKGTLVLLDTERMQCVSRVSVSEAEAFATPARIAENRILMPVSEGRLTFWRIKNDKLEAEETINVADSFNEAVIVDNIFWAIAKRTVFAIRATQPTEQLTFKLLGDDLRAIAPGCHGKTALIADGALICVKGF